MKKKDISSIFKNNVHKSDIKFTNWIIKKETNKNEDRNSLPGLSLLSRRGRERERRRAWSFFLGHPFETEVGSWNSWCWSGRLVKVETQAGRIWERERDGEFLKFDFKMKEKGRRAIEIFMGKMVFWKYEMCPILTGWFYQMWDDVERMSHKILSRMGVGYTVFWVTWRSKQESHLHGLELLGGSSFIIFFSLFFSLLFFFFFLDFFFSFSLK